MRITRATDPGFLDDLLRDPPRANLAFVVEGRIDGFPVVFRFVKGRYLVGMPEDGPSPDGGQAAKLLIDDGYHYFDLRGTWIRGRLFPRAQRPAGAAPGLHWFELRAEKTVAWHYGTMREREREPG